MESAESCSGLIIFTGIATALVGLFVGYVIGLRDSLSLRENRRRP
jgi:hypothetical protein